MFRPRPFKSLGVAIVQFQPPDKMWRRKHSFCKRLNLILRFASRARMRVGRSNLDFREAVGRLRGIRSDCSRMLPSKLYWHCSVVPFLFLEAGEVVLKAAFMSSERLVLTEGEKLAG